MNETIARGKVVSGKLIKKETDRHCDCSREFENTYYYVEKIFADDMIKGFCLECGDNLTSFLIIRKHKFLNSKTYQCARFCFSCFQRFLDYIEEKFSEIEVNSSRIREIRQKMCEFRIEYS